MGDQVGVFQRQFARYLNSQYCVMVNSGSSANLLMVAALFYTRNESLSLRRGDEVIVPAVSWSTTYSPLQQYGLKLRFVDIDLHTLNYDLAQLKKSLTKRTRMIVAVNLLGNPNDFNRIGELINAESPDAILSDDGIVQLLRTQGIDIARRTVAKYREALRIPSSTQRRRDKALSF